MTEKEEKYMAFKKAVKYDAKLRMAIAGPSGSGKTYTALAIGTAMSKKVALVDTEHGSASKYADLFEFDVMELAPPFHPQRFCDAIKQAEAAGYEIVILDSLSHAWFADGGLLSIVDDVAATLKGNNTFAAWKTGTPIQNALVEAIIGANLHIIGTMRSKQEYAMSQDDRGKTTVRKVGMAPIQREGFEYEFDVFAEMDMDNRMIVSKTRCPSLVGKVFPKPGTEVATILNDWLSGQAKPHWLDEKAKRDAFFAKLGDYGLDEEAAKKLTGIAHFHDWDGTANELLQLIKGKIPPSKTEQEYKKNVEALYGKQPA